MLKRMNLYYVHLWYVTSHKVLVEKYIESMKNTMLSHII